MAGTYADIPGKRLDLSRDGTIIQTWHENAPSAITQFTPTQVAAVMDLDPGQSINGTSVSYDYAVFSILFPEARTITGLYYQITSGGGSGSCTVPNAQYSTDTTDGVNGTWTSWGFTGARVTAGTPLPFYRSSIQAASQANVRGIRLRGNYNSSNTTTSVELRCLHIYANRPTASIDRLAFWHPTADQELAAAYFDFGDLNRGVIAGGRPFRIKNLSATKKASGMQVNAVGMSGSNFSTPGIQLSTDDSAYSTSSPAAVDLNPGAISAVYYARLNLGDTLMTPQTRGGRLYTSAGSYA